MIRNITGKSLLSEIASWVFVLSFFGGLVIWIGVNFMPWQVAVAAAVVVDALLAVALRRSEREYYHGNPDRDRREEVFSCLPARREATPKRAIPTELVRKLTDPLAVATSIRTVQAVTSPGSDLLH